MRSHVSSAWRENWSLSGDNAIFTISWKKTHFATLDTWILQITIIYTSVRCFTCFFPTSLRYLYLFSSSLFHLLCTLNLYLFFSAFCIESSTACSGGGCRIKKGLEKGKGRNRAYKKLFLHECIQHGHVLYLQYEYMRFDSLYMRIMMNI